MPTEYNDVISGPYHGRPIRALGGDDRIHWGRADGTAILYAGDLGEHYDPNPYTIGNPGGDRLYITGTQGVSVRFATTESGTATVGGRTLTFHGVERLYGTGGGDVINAANARVAPAHGTTPEHGISVYAGAGRDRIVGSGVADIIDGGAGDDTIRARGGDDFIQSSRGNDLIHGGGGNENIRWGLGDDVAPGNDTIHGGSAGEGIGDLINVWVVNADWTTGARVVFTSDDDGRAVSTMGGVTSTLHFYDFENGWTHRADDTVTGANAAIGSDMRGFRFNTRWGDDIIVGSRGNDTLEGGEDRDTITGGRGDDLISANGEYYNRNAPGDGDVDTLFFAAGDGADTILGFDTGVDILRTGGRSFVATERGDGTLLSFGQGDSILLGNVFDFI